MKRVYNIAFICDDNYCMPTEVCIRSIVDYKLNNDITYCIHVCTFGLTEENKKSLSHLNANNCNVQIDVFNKDSIESRLSSVVQRSHVTPTALIKFELANHFQGIDTILYMDSDIVTKGDIEELFATNISDCYLAASFEFWKHVNKINYSLNHSLKDKSWFNSGVMLMNLKKMRDDGIPEQLWDYKLHKAKTTLMDQESLIAVCSKSMHQLSLIWNFNPIFLNQIYLNEVNKVYGTSFSNLSELKDAVKIIHYVGKTDKPWKYQQAHMREYWDVAFANMNSPFKLDLQHVPESKSRNLVIASLDKIHTYGLSGYLCFVINKILRKI